MIVRDLIDALKEFPEGATVTLHMSESLACNGTSSLREIRLERAVKDDSDGVGGDYFPSNDGEEIVVISACGSDD